MVCVSLCLVPTAPPQEVEVVAINSTTIRFTWNPPPQQFINGINQGYKVSLWMCVCVCYSTLSTLSKSSIKKKTFLYLLKKETCGVATLGKVKQVGCNQQLDC